jgi:hypothetical protein
MGLLVLFFGEVVLLHYKFLIGALLVHIVVVGLSMLRLLLLTIIDIGLFFIFVALISALISALRVRFFLIT